MSLRSQREPLLDPPYAPYSTVGTRTPLETLCGYLKARETNGMMLMAQRILVDIKKVCDTLFYRRNVCLQR